MPVINLFIFPIMGGYYILIRAELIRYRQQRLEPQKIIFNSFLAGLFVLIGSWLVAKSVSYWFPNFLKEIQSYYPVKQKYFGTCVGSFILAILFAEISNWFFKKDKQISKAINKIGNEFERLCESCYRDLHLMQVTLKNDKCYVGLIKALPIPSHSSYIRMLPVLSGYRDKETKKLEFTTQYLDVYATYVQEGSVYDVGDITTLIIKIDEIVTATKFDVEMYDRFMAQEEIEGHNEENPNKATT